MEQVRRLIVNPAIHTFKPSHIDAHLWRQIALRQTANAPAKPLQWSSSTFNTKLLDGINSLSDKPHEKH